MARSSGIGQVIRGRLTVGQFGGVRGYGARERLQECGVSEAARDILAVTRNVGLEVLGQLWANEYIWDVNEELRRPKTQIARALMCWLGKIVEIEVALVECQGTESI